MSVTATQLIDEARKYLGVPYANQGRTPEIGFDCGGLWLVVGHNLGLTELEELGYSNSPDGERFERLLDENCDRVESYKQPKLSNLLAVDYGLGIQHIACVTRLDVLTVIHSKRPSGNASKMKGRGVIEHRLLPSMADFRGWVRTYRIRGVIDG